MSDLHFLNARLRALRGRLLPGKEVERLRLLPDLPSLVAALREGPYGPAIEAAGGAGDDAARLEEALRRDFSATLSRLLAMAGEDCRGTVRRFLEYWELRALRAIVRGKSARRPAEEILAALVPAGLHDEAAMEELCRQPDLRALIDLLATWRDPAAPALLRAMRGYRGPHDVWMLESALDRGFFGERPRRGERDDLGLFLSLAADRANLVAALTGVAERIAPEAMRRWFLPGGMVYGRDDIDRILSAGSVAEAARLASRSCFAPVLSGVAAQGGGISIPAVERQLDRVLLSAMRGRMRVDPLGAAPVASYLLEKAREVANLRTIFRGRLANLEEGDVAKLLVPGV